jgi:hypothetical protein
MTVPGVNLIGAASFVAAVNANRFLTTSRKLVANSSSRAKPSSPTNEWS